MSKCTGCGAILQNQDKNDVGYTKDILNNLCERCFRIKNYNEYSSVIKSNDDFINILREVNNTNELVILVVDLFNINKSIEIIENMVNNNVLLVLSKRDILPKSCYDEKFIRYFDNCNLNVIDTVIISSKKNYNFDCLFEKINKYKKSNKVYVIGFTNAGKSTMINKIIYNYSEYNSEITTSNIPSTTIDCINVKVNDSLELIDTPGIIDEGDITNYISSNELKKIQPNKEIKPITYQVKGKQYFIIDNLAILEIEDVNITLYISNSLNVTRKYKNVDIPSKFVKNKIFVSNNSDIVIQGLGFINFSKECNANVYLTKGVCVYSRKELI